MCWRALPRTLPGRRASNAGPSMNGLKRAGFWSLVLCRMAVGVGEASFVSLAAPFIGARGWLCRRRTDAAWGCSPHFCAPSGQPHAEALLDTALPLVRSAGCFWDSPSMAELVACYGRALALAGTQAAHAQS